MSAKGMVVEFPCPHCGRLIDTGCPHSKADHAIRSAVLTEEEDNKVREFIEYMVWCKQQDKKRRKKS